MHFTPSPPLPARVLPATLSVSVPPGVLLPGVLAPDCGTDCATKRVLRCAIALGGPAVSCACTHVKEAGSQRGALQYTAVPVAAGVQPKSTLCLQAPDRPCTLDDVGHLLRR
jgi:hypothetical protein